MSAEVVKPLEAKSRSVAVLSDPFTEDVAEADKLASMVREQLTSKGFKIKESESEAELVVIATIERSDATVSPASATVRRPADLTHGMGQSSLLQSQNAFQNLGFEFHSVPVQEPPKVGLMVTAVSRDEWFKSLGEGQSQIPRVWRITAIGVSKKVDITPKLVEAIGAKVEEITGTSTAEKPNSTPAPSPKKKKKKEER
ncbi:MAG TPA: hypothetical protein VIT23_13230 [Terrimicrobiaceae bacterium]